jgi:hypothetical protein
MRGLAAIAQESMSHGFTSSSSFFCTLPWQKFTELSISTSVCYQSHMANFDLKQHPYKGEMCCKIGRSDGGADCVGDKGASRAVPTTVCCPTRPLLGHGINLSTHVRGVIDLTGERFLDPPPHS